MKVEFRVTATSASEATDQAKKMARQQGYRVLTLASVRQAESVALPADDAVRRDWTVSLAVRPS